MTPTKTEDELIAAAFTSCRTNKVPMTDEIYAIFKDGYIEKGREITIQYCINNIISILARNRDAANKVIGQDTNGRATLMYREATKFVEQLEELHDFVTNSQDLKQ